MAHDKSKKDKAQRSETDLASDDRFGWRFVKTMVSSAANDIGRLGYDVGAIRTLMDTIESVLGPQMTSLGINALAALVQNPKILKEYLRAAGLPSEVNNLIDEFIDDLFEGLRMGMRDGDKKLDDEGRKAAEQKALGNLRDKLGRLEIRSYEQMVGSLSPEELGQLLAALQQLSAEQRKLFDSFYKSKIVASRLSGFRGFIAQAVHGNTNDVLVTLYGVPAQPIVNTTIAKLKSGVTKLDATVREHLEVKDPHNDPVHIMLQERARRARRRQGA